MAPNCHSVHLSLVGSGIVTKSKTSPAFVCVDLILLARWDWSAESSHCLASPDRTWNYHTSFADASWLPIGGFSKQYLLAWLISSSRPAAILSGLTARCWMLVVDSKPVVAYSLLSLTAASCRHSFCLGEQSKTLRYPIVSPVKFAVIRF